ncbi:TM2 domain-containing protein [Flavobacterium sp. FlaQc-48]|uniref:TM2 domain-containing protein n=1 Tax=Flavobacterium sp. FlaQc-48 TaxID=3374181 RepID=UPI0037574064
MKSKLTAAILAFFFGGIGIHKFYLGQSGQGILYLLFCWTFIPSIIAFFQFFGLLFMSDHSFNVKYNNGF